MHEKRQSVTRVPGSLASTPMHEERVRTLGPVTRGVSVVTPGSKQADDVPLGRVSGGGGRDREGVWRLRGEGGGQTQ